MLARTLATASTAAVATFTAGYSAFNFSDGSCVGHSTGRIAPVKVR
jgi:hypothetical protein